MPDFALAAIARCREMSVPSQVAAHALIHCTLPGSSNEETYLRECQRMMMTQTSLDQQCRQWQSKLVDFTAALLGSTTKMVAGS
jgi:hypothetical protein